MGKLIELDIAVPQEFLKYANDVADVVVDRMIQASTGFAPSDIAEARQEQRRRVAILIADRAR